MATKSYSFIVDLKNPSEIAPINIVQGDTDSNIFNISLTVDNGPVDLTDSTIAIVMCKANGDKVVDVCTIVDALKGLITYTVASQGYAVLGTVLCSIEITKGLSRTTSQQFKFKVVTSLNDEDLITSQTDYPILTQLINDVQGGSVVYKPMVTTYANIATTYPNPENGWTVQTSDTRTKYRWNGTSWVPMGSYQDDHIGDMGQITETNLVAAIKNDRTELASHTSELESHASQLAEKANKLNIYNRISTVATADGGNYSSTFDYTHLNNDKKILSGTPARVGAWIDLPTRTGNAENKPFIEVDLPFGVVIGDSIAQGHPALGSRLEQTSGTLHYQSDYPNQEGQLSYELGKLTGMYWYNHGIGSQTSVDIWNRWNRDVLGQTYDAGDGIGSSTLIRKAYAVWIHVGINDVFLNVPEATTKANMINMAQSCRDNSIICIFDNIGEHNLASDSQRALILDLDTWMKTTLRQYGAYVNDYYTWSKNPNGTGLRTDGFYADYVHPTTYGYQSMAINMYQQLTNVPINYHELHLGMTTEAGDAVKDSLAYAKDITIKMLVASGQTETPETFNFILNDNTKESLVKIKPSGYGYKARIIINSVYPHGSSSYVGFSCVDVSMSCPSNSEQSTNKVNADNITNNTFGTFTPILAGATTPGAHTYTKQTGYYTLIGKICFFHIELQTSAKDSTVLGNLLITGLPFASSNISGNNANLSVGYAYLNHPTNAVSIGARIEKAENQIRVYYSCTDGSSAPLIAQNAMNDISGLFVSGFYFIE